jgi:glycerophosphoryl diester phosphodiesterase
LSSFEKAESSSGAMSHTADRPLDWRHGLKALRRAWKSLIVYELLMSLLSTAVLAPLVLTCSYQLIGISGEAVLGNWDLIRFALSPIGAVALLLVVSMTLGVLFVEYSGLMLLADAALRGTTLSTRNVIAWVFSAAPRLFGLAALQSTLAILAALPFLGLAAVVYWFLLSDSDINFYLAERPPRFWVAVMIGMALTIAFIASAAWFFAQWAFSVPACVLNGQSWLAALRVSSRLVRGRTWRLLLVMVGWQLLKDGAFFAALMGLDWGNKVLFARFEDGFSAVLWSTVTFLLFDALVLQLLGAVFAIGLAVLLAYEYEQARRSESGPKFIIPLDPSASSLPWPAWRTRAAIVAIAIMGPLASIAYAVVFANKFIEHRPVGVTAHRAGPKSAPENSLLALQLSIAAGADLVEIDVQQTADGHVVLLHDRDLRRVTGDARNLHDVNLADLEDLRLKAVGGESSDSGILTLSEFITACDGKIRMNIELKDYGHSPQLATAVLDVLRERGFTDRAIVSCFELAPLVELRQMEPGLPVGIILSIGKGDVTRLPVDFLSLNHRLVRAEIVRRAHQRGMEVHAWTVNDRETALRLLDLGCDNLITSDPALMRELVDSYVRLGGAERMLLRLRRWLRE